MLQNLRNPEENEALNPHTCDRTAVRDLTAEEAAAKAALHEGQQAAAELEAKARETSQLVQELRSEVVQLREQLTSSDQSVQVVAALLCLQG